MEMHTLGQRVAAEFVGAALLVFIGAGSVPALLLLNSSSESPFTGSELGFVAIAFGLALMAMIYTVGKVSGCHINPAVTLALAATRRFSRADVLPYWAAQVAGGIAGALAIWAAFGGRAFDVGIGVVDFDGADTAWASAIFVETLGTAVLVLVILGIVDTRSPEGWAGLVIGLVLTALILATGPITGASFNPARALGPLAVSHLNDGFHNWIEQLLAYIPANLAGAAIGAFAYDAIATPRRIVQPIKEAVSEPDRAASYGERAPGS